jgi:hypothetical protein
VFLAVVAAGCQDYNFNPVGHCLIQPGTQRVALSNVSTADVLFVVDDSGSMGEEQAALAANFNHFIDNLNATNQVRAGGGLVPIDFHIAVTTSSVYWNFETPTLTTCRSSCPGAGGQRVCCDAAGPVRRPKRCTSNTQCTVAGTECRLDCERLHGEFYCCDATGSAPTTELIPCSREGTACGTLETHFDMQGCSNAIALNQWPYPQGDFVSRLSSLVPAVAGAPGPRVLHFDKELYGAGAVNKQGFDATTLVELFKEMVPAVGSCGSGQEQALQAARLAIQKALSGRQKDTYDAAGDLKWTPGDGTTTLPTFAPGSARWPNPNSKLVVVFVGDEDDCSSPQDPSGGVVMLSEFPNCAQQGTCDACQRDEATPLPLGKKQWPVSDFVSFFKGLNRPVAAAFILPATQTTCSLQTCTTDGLCGTAQAQGKRLLRTAQALSAAGVEVVAGSICDPDFGQLLEDIAEIVKPPQTLTLPTEPAEGRITVLRIAAGNGSTRKLCGAPLAPGSYPGAGTGLGAAQSTGADWWFTAGADPGEPVAISRYVYLNPEGSCRANPGETYSADYLGVLPEGGCATVDDCADKLGGQTSQWECFMPPGLTRGTCTCGGNQ